MRWNKSSILYLLLIVITVSFTLNKLREAADIKDQYQSVSVRLHSDTITKSRLDQAVNKEKEDKSSFLEVTPWTCIRGESISNPLLRRKQKLSVIIVSGNMQIVAPMKLSSGNYVSGDDKNGCVLDTKTSYELFGTINATGSLITYQDKEYLVRGIVKTRDPLVILQADQNWKGITNLEFEFDRERIEKGEDLTREFLLTYGLTEDYVLIDGYFYSDLVRTILCLPVWMLYFAGILILAKRYLALSRHSTEKAMSMKPWVFALYGLIGGFTMLGFGFLLYDLTGNIFHLSGKFIPPKWSDFDFWSNRFRFMKEQIRQLRYLTPTLKDITLEQALSRLTHDFSLMIVLFLLNIICGSTLLRFSPHSRQSI